VDSCCKIFIDPADGCRGFIVVADVAHELARQIIDRTENASRNNVALNLGASPLFCVGS
jgi:hypothetical protein